jgi:nucleotidyltransferase substrate binding protein (TIGR01987 family)
MNTPPFDTDRFQTALQNLKKAFSALEVSAKTPIQEPRDLSGIIKDFEITYELSWKCLKKFLEKEGHEIKSARNAFSKAYQLGYIDHEKEWLAILQDRNLTVHTYDQRFAKEMCDRIKDSYVERFRSLVSLLESQP